MSVRLFEWGQVALSALSKEENYKICKASDFVNIVGADLSGNGSPGTAAQEDVIG